MNRGGRMLVMQSVVTVATSVVAAVIAAMLIDMWREKKQGAALPRPPVDGFDVA